jgi:hypothetical protein
MLPTIVKKSASLFLIVMILAASGFCLCGEAHAQEPSWGGESRETYTTGTAAADHCPGCPDGGHSQSSHDASSCYCSCHLPITEQLVRIQHDPETTEIISFEPFTALPKVYLPRFIPPQNLV